MGFQDALIIEEDNQACVYASKILLMTRGMRHLDLAELLIKGKVDAKEIKLLKVASADNTSDLGTKRLAFLLFNKLTSRKFISCKIHYRYALLLCCLVCLLNEDVFV